MQKIKKYILIFVIIRNIQSCYPIIDGQIKTGEDEYFFKGSHSDLKSNYSIKKNTDYYATFWTIENEYFMESPKFEKTKSIPRAVMMMMAK